MKKIAVMLLSAVLALSALTGCNKNKINSNSPETLEIYIYNAGYGWEWCKEVLDEFKEEQWVKDKYPNLVTDIYKDELQNSAANYLAAGGDRYDLLFGTNLTVSLGPDKLCQDLTETVFNQPVPGEEGIKVKDKMIPSALEAAQYTIGDPNEEKHYYMMNWFGGMMGIMYNKTQFENLRQGGKAIELPRTTKEFVDILTGIKNGSITGWVPTGSSKGEPFSTYNPSKYIDFASNVWWAQYDGIKYDKEHDGENDLDGYNDFYYGRNHSGVGNVYGPEVITNSKGLLKTYEMLQTFLPSSLGLTWNNSNTGRDNFVDTQNKVLRGEHLFMITGDWVMNELKSVTDGMIELGMTPDTVSMMPIPVISSIVDALPDKSFTDDTTLSKVIKAIDEDKTFEECKDDLGGVTKNDWNKIYEARHIAYSTGSLSNAFIPRDAAGFGPAQDFLRYMATDKAQEIYMKTTNGCMLPFEYDTKQERYTELYNGFSALNKAALDVLLDPDIEFLLPEDYFPLKRIGSFTIDQPVANRAEAIRTGTKPQELIDKMYGFWNEGNRFNTAMNSLPYKWQNL